MSEITTTPTPLAELAERVKLKPRSNINDVSRYGVHRWDDLPTRIKKLHRMAQESACNAIDYARLAGELLIKAKKSVGHGEWLAWLAANVAFSDRTARNYMRIARALPKLDDEFRQHLADLSFRDLLATLATDTSRLSKLSEPATKTVIETAESRPLRSSVTLVATAERVRLSQQRPTITKVPAPMVIEPTFSVTIPQWRVELRDKIVSLVSATMTEHRLSAAEAIEALSDAYCKLQDGTLA